MGDGIIKSYSKVLITILIIGIVSIAGGIVGYSYYQDKVEEAENQHAKALAEEQSKREKEAASKEEQEKENKELISPEDSPEDAIYDAMHKMANTKIVAEDGQIWGEIPIDKESIKKVRDIVEKVAYEDRDYILEVLNRWDKGDFSQVVDEHNYFWAKLGGNVGKAVSARPAE